MGHIHKHYAYQCTCVMQCVSLLSYVYIHPIPTQSDAKRAKCFLFLKLCHLVVILQVKVLNSELLSKRPPAKHKAMSEARLRLSRKSLSWAPRILLETDLKSVPNGMLASLQAWNGRHALVLAGARCLYRCLLSTYDLFTNSTNILYYIIFSLLSDCIESLRHRIALRWEHGVCELVGLRVCKICRLRINISARFFIDTPMEKSIQDSSWIG